jgi:hypothetical protein
VVEAVTTRQLMIETDRYFEKKKKTKGRTKWPHSLSFGSERPLACWNCWSESGRKHRNSLSLSLSLVSVVYFQVEASASG